MCKHKKRKKVMDIYQCSPNNEEVKKRKFVGYLICCCKCKKAWEVKINGHKWIPEHLSIKGVH